MQSQSSRLGYIRYWERKICGR